jgi:hypothetical protein
LSVISSFLFKKDIERVTLPLMFDLFWLAGSFCSIDPKGPTSFYPCWQLARHLMLYALGLRFGEPVDEAAPSIKTVTPRVPSRDTGASTNQNVSITKLIFVVTVVSFSIYSF